MVNVELLETRRGHPLLGKVTREGPQAKHNTGEPGVVLGVRN